MSAPSDTAISTHPTPAHPTPQRYAAQQVYTAAVAVANPDRPVLLLVARNGRKERAGWETLENLGRLAETNPERFERLSFAVAVADDVLAVDCDTPEAVDAAHQIAQWCRDAGTEPVLVESGRPGNAHLWCVTNNPALHRACVRHAARAGGDVRTGRYMRPPGAAHPTGAAVHIEGGLDTALAVLAVERLENAGITAEDTNIARVGGSKERREQRHSRHGFAALHGGRTPNERQHDDARAGDGAPNGGAPNGGAPNDISAKIAARLAANTLTTRTLELLRHGDDRGDRSATMQSVLVGMLNRGWTIDAAWDALMVSRHVGGAKLQERAERYGNAAAWTYLTHSWDNAAAWVEANPARGCSPEDAEAIDALAAEADTYPWPGEPGASAWMVLHVLCVTGRRGPGLTVGASERHLAESCALGRASVHRALERLCDDGWITRLQVGRGPLASVWQLETGAEARTRRDTARTTDPLPHPPTRNPAVGGDLESGTFMHFGADAFRRGALGANGYRVLRRLYLHGAGTTTTLAAELGIHQGSVARILNRCAEAALTERLADGTWALTTHETHTEATPTETANVATTAHSIAAGHPTAPEHVEDAPPPWHSRSERGHRSVLVCDPSRLGAVAERWGTVGARVRARAFHAAEREEYARSSAYSAAVAQIRRAA